MRVLVVGSGAREHALAWALHRSPRVSAVYAAPGNAGLSFLARTAPVAADDVRGLMRTAVENGIDLTVVGPEGPLAAGIVDQFQEAGLRIFGPTASAARLEASKIWAKEFMDRHGIPTARWSSAEDPLQAREKARRFDRPVMLKADGLAGGKGAIVCRSDGDVDTSIRELMEEAVHGDAGRRIVVEEFLNGVELSVFALADGKGVLPLTGARDYKRLLDGDLGPNTGGMGGYAPPPYATPDLMAEITRTILEPTVAGMQAEGCPYVGILYAGLMLTDEGPKVLEYNCRWGDPEAQLVLPLLKSDFVDLMEACMDQRLHETHVEWLEGFSCAVVLASEGYPDNPRAGMKISGLDELEPGVLAFHGATQLVGDSSPPRGLIRQFMQRTTADDLGITASGGRVLTLVATGSTLDEARARVYANVERIKFEGMQYRGDLGLDASSGTTSMEASGAVAPAPPDQAAARDTGALPPPTAAPDLELKPEPSIQAGEPAPEGKLAETAAMPEAAPSATREPGPTVAVLMGSESDRPVMDETVKALNELGVRNEVHVLSAHRTPDRVREFARSAESRGIRVLIAGAGGAAHLPGVLASHTTLPVIGIPIAGSSLMGLDALLSIVQMPGGIPVATVAVGTAGARNAAYLAAAILGLADENIRRRYRQFRVDQSKGDLQ